jgi:hypothetical protein
MDKPKWQSPIRLGTVKPAKYIFRDALVVSILTVLVTIVIYFFMYLFASNLEFMQTLGFWEVIAKSFAISMTLNVFYEVGGINAFLCESASRYYTDTALNKYTTRANAIVDSLSAEAAMTSLPADPSLQKIRDNQKKFHAMVRATVMAPRIAEFMHEFHKKNKKYPTSDEVYSKLVEPQRDAAKLTKEDVALLMNLHSKSSPEENLNKLEAVPRLIEVLGMTKNQEAVKYFIKNGFEKLRSKMLRKGPTLDLTPLADLKIVAPEKTAIQRGMHWLSGIPLFSALASSAPGEEESECE